MSTRPVRRAAARGSAVGAALALLLGGGCGRSEAVPATPTPAVTPSAPSPRTTTTAPLLLVGDGMVLDPGSGPELCLGSIATSYPPQCSGVPIDGWTWPRPGTTRAGRVTWGDFQIVGTWHAGRFAFDRLATDREVKASLPEEDTRKLDTPCPAPEGGWKASDPARSRSDDQERVIALAEKLPDFVDLWVDDRGDAGQDPLTTVVNVQVTENAAAAEGRLRTVWGGPLCVSLGPHTQKELARVRAELADEPGMLSSWTGNGVLTLQLVYDDGTRQRRYDDRYGAGTVAVESALRPLRG